MKKILVAIAVIILIYGTYKGYRHYRHYKALEQAESFIGQKVADSKLFTVDRKKIALSKLRGKDVVIVFWASWCEYCKKEIPNIIEFYKSMDKNSTYLFSVAIDKKKQDLDSFLKKRALPYPVVFDKDLEFTKQFQVVGVPSIWIINKEGIILAQNLRDIRSVQNILKKQK